MFIQDEMSFFCPHAPKALRTARATRRDGLWPCGAKAPALKRRSNKRVHQNDGSRFGLKRKRANARQLLKCCALPTWWSWRGSCTRSHSEHGREMPLRLWYSVLRRGRVGRCQVCKAQHVLISKSTKAFGQNIRPRQRPLLFLAFAFGQT